MVTSCACFGPRHSPNYNYLRRASDIVAVRTIFNVFSYDAVTDRDSNLSSTRRRADALRVDPRSRVFLSVLLWLLLCFLLTLSSLYQCNLWTLERGLKFDIELHYIFRKLSKEEVNSNSNLQVSLFTWI